MTYRDPNELETLRRENEALRAELEQMRGGLHPYSQKSDPCRKCDAHSVRDYFKIVGNEIQTVKQATGPDRIYQPAVAPSFWRKGRPERFKLTCQFCKATYYERTKE